MKMKGTTLALSLILAGSLGLTPAAWAKCETLYTYAQHRIRQAEYQQKKDPQTLEEAKRCAETGLQRHRENRHPEGMKTLRACLKMLAD